MNRSEPLIPNTNFIERDLGDEIVIMSQDGQEIHSFEDTAIAIWKLIKTGSSPDNIVAEIQNEFEVEEELAKQDLSGFLVDLKHKGIIK